MYSEDLKNKTIFMYTKLSNFRQVASLLNIGKSTVHRWVTNYTLNKITNVIDINKILHT